MGERNARRIKLAEKAVSTYVQAADGDDWPTLRLDMAGCAEGSGDDYCAVQDLITNLMHLADKCGWNANELARRAVANFEHETSPIYDGD